MRPVEDLFTFSKRLTVIVIILYILPLQARNPSDGYGAGLSQAFILQLEAGPVWQSVNDVQIPNDNEGTRFSLTDLTGSGPYPSVRFYFTWQFLPRHALRILLAPLSYTESGKFNVPVSFAGQLYEAHVPVGATYKFNSWRITYRYKFHAGDRWNWWVGFTAKIRDAKIKLEQNGISSEKTDVGFVPLLHLRGMYNFNERWWMLLDVDALAGGPGRAEDATLQLGYDISDTWAISAGYRMVEGGADVEEVYNFAWFHYLVINLQFTF